MKLEQLQIVQIRQNYQDTSLPRPEQSNGT